MWDKNSGHWRNIELDGFLGFVLGGKGKIGTSAQRISIIDTIRKMNNHCAYGKESGNTIGHEVIEGAVKLFKNEG